MVSWTFLTSHARVLMLVAHDPGIRLRDIAASLGISERSAFGIITDLAEAGYVVREKNGRRNRYHIQAHLPLPEPTSQERTVGEVLALLTGTGPRPRPAQARRSGREPRIQPGRPARHGGNRCRASRRRTRAAGPRRASPRSWVPGARRQAGT